MNLPAPIEVLLVEDNPGDVRLVKELLVVSRRAPLNLSHVETIKEAIEFIAGNEVSVVLLDLSLPDGYGLDTFTRLHNAAPDLPILVVTSLDDEDMALSAMREGAQDYLVKGYLSDVSPERAIRYAIERQRIEMENRRLNAELETRVLERTAELNSVRQKLENILNYSPDPILAVDQSGGLLAANPVFSEMFGYGVSELPRLSLHDLVTDQDLAALERALHAVMTMRSVQRLEATARRSDGTTFTVSLALSPDQGNNGAGAVCIVRDVTGEKEIERIKDEFVSNVSHELRTPITSIKLNLSLLSSPRSDPEVVLARLGRECTRLTTIVEDLLLLARIEQNTIVLNPSTFNLNNLAGELVEDRVPLASSRGLSLRLEKQISLPDVVADQGMLGMGLSVLLTNAMNYTPSGGEVIVRTGSGVNESREWIGLEVADTGPGIPPGEQAQLFVRFFRGQAGRSSGLPGTGLGLSIVSEIAQRHGGYIEVRSEGIPGKGASFTLWLPGSVDEKK